MKSISSIFFNRYNDLMSLKDPTTLKLAIKDIVVSSGIKEIDKRRIFLNISSLETLSSLQRYLTNSMLQYQGMGVR
jgi:ABC-type lipoprotein release transport system permease subunit